MPGGGELVAAVARLSCLPVAAHAQPTAALVAAWSSGPEVVQQHLHKMLLARYQAYRTSGLAGIATYDRGGGRFSNLAADLRKVSEAAFHAVLLGYPIVTVPQVQENLFWLKSIIQGKPTYVLTHVMAAPDGAARAIARRHYYASTGYNGEQSVAGFLPVQGGTVVVCLAHATPTDRE